MKKYESPEFNVLRINMDSIMLIESNNPVPGLDPIDSVKDFEDIESDLFGGESFGGAEEW